MCVFSQHPRCDNIQEIAMAAKHSKDDERKNIRTSIITASEVIMKCKDDQMNNVSRAEELVKEVDDFNQTLLKKIEKAKERFVREMTDCIKQEEERLNTRRITAETLKKELDKLLAMLDSVHGNGKESEIFILNHILKMTQDNALQTLNTLLDNDYTVNMGLKLDKNLSKIKTTDVAIFSRKKTQEPKPISLNGDTTSVNNVHQRPTLTLLKTMDLMKTGDDKYQPYMTGMDFLPDGRIIAVDNCNWKCFILSDSLKRFDAFYKFKNYPRDVTSYSDDNIAVTVNDRTICLLTVGIDNTITPMKTLNMATYCDSICPLNNHTFVVSTCDDPLPAKMINVNGQRSDFENVRFPLKTYKIDESKCAYIPSRDLLVFTDRYANTVYTFNTVTGKITEITDSRIREPRGVSVGPDDSVYVCSENTNTIIKISPGGDILESYDVDMRYPRSVAVSRDGSRMAVTNIGIGWTNLKLFRIIH
ncbi:uncharacterized protein LOC128205934 [Mya arenaria]|uniref:uncharacterized protein LOC128205934 n=1 Tax=Mya arenaria TaxID=6604 RepID=UPI0022E95232|nr:uncharacterized protein LOC128205934 [Mya arenaria]